jgi:hypothetical protein
MTLPDSEIKRIGIASKAYYEPTEIKLVRINRTTEASLWYERMGKFAEWIEDERWQYKIGDGENHWWYSPIEDKLINTPELINEFLKIK